MGTITVRLFARAAELAGTRTLQLDTGEGLRAADAFALLANDHPALQALEPTVMYAINREYVDADHPLQDGDELAIIPPVSGGARAL